MGNGLLMWRDSRWTKAKSFNANWDRFSVQLGFILYELNTTHVDANVKILNCDVIDNTKRKNLPDILGRFYAPNKQDYSGPIKQLYENFKNADGK
jgi:hypothetical protein